MMPTLRAQLLNGHGATVAFAALGAALALASPRIKAALLEPHAALAARAPEIVETPLAPPARLAAPHPFGKLFAPEKPQPLGETSGVAPEEVARFVEAANFYRRNDFAHGDAAAAALTDPVARAGADWVALRVAATPARLDAFEAAYPNWSFADWRRALREGWLFSGHPSPSDIAAVLHETAPKTPGGGVALARAELALGRRDEAARSVRALWRTDDLDGAAETAVLREFGTLLTRDDHLARASRLAYAERGAAAWRAAAQAGADALALVSARLEAARGPLSARASSAVPLPLRADPGYAFAHVQDSRRAGRLDEAVGWLKLAPADPEKLIDPDKWWSERRMIARAALDRGQPQVAYEVAAGAIAKSSPARVDAAFHAGWIALRFLNDPARAAAHFAAAAEAAQTPISISRAYYWRGRAAEAMDRLDDARGFYARAAAYPIAYYGQLAAERLGAETVTPRRPQTAAEGDARALATRVIELYLDAGLDDFASPLAYDAAKSWSDGEQLAGLAQVLRLKASAAVNVTFGKLSTERGFPLDAVAFPTFGLTEFSALPGSADMAQVLAVARQESEFLPRAASGAGAKGLMQILPGTAADTARHAGVPYDYGRLLNDPAYNLQLGAAYLGQLVSAEGGSLALAAAAYNAGAGRVSQWIAAYGDPRSDRDAMVDWIERIPYDETRDYVMRVSENHGIYKARLAEAPEPRAQGLLARR